MPHRGAAQGMLPSAASSRVQNAPERMRVLWIAAHPDDEDTQLIAWLARGRRVETAYLSLTRGDGGQNLIGNELGEALGVIRTEELLAARRIDGAHQYFARGYDFGFSKTADETRKHWPQDSLLNDVMTVMRAFKPHIVITTFSGTPRDGHGHHQVSAIVARQAYDMAADTVRFPVKNFGPVWTPLKFYRLARFSPQDRTIAINVGEYDPNLGLSYQEIAADSRSQHKSQGQGTLRRKGVVWDYLTREDSRVPAPPAKEEKSI
ncbi:MAG TPA: PIG-L family deacetylase, partial [Gemmatimonadaceae bacterium]|nr:PIG-L family deacetylase [Gemmatimonadaceae bacterium]